MKMIGALLRFSSYLGLLACAFHALFLLLYASWAGGEFKWETSLIITAFYALLMLFFSKLYAENKSIWNKVSLQNFSFAFSLRALLFPLTGMAILVSCLAFYEITFFGMSSGAIALAIMGENRKAEVLFKQAKNISGRLNSIDEVSLFCIENKTSDVATLSELTQKDLLISEVYGANSSERSMSLRMLESFHRAKGETHIADKYRERALGILTDPFYCLKRLQRIDMFSQGESSASLLNHFLSLSVILCILMTSLRNVLVPLIMFSERQKLKAVENPHEKISTILNLCDLALIQGDKGKANNLSMLALKISEDATFS